MRTNYCRSSTTILKEHQERRQSENVDIIEEEKRKRIEGLNLTEKIEKELEKVKKKGVVSHMTDSFYEMVEENGSNFYLRRTNLLRDNGRTLNIVDEIEVQEKEERI